MSLPCAHCLMHLSPWLLLFFRRGGVDRLVCSGRGECGCICICEPRENPDEMVFGEACECDNFRCPVSDSGTVCSGKSAL